MAEIQFFGEIDRNKEGNVSSDMPAWFFDAQIDEMEEAVGRKRRELDKGDVPIQHYPLKKQQLKNLEAKLEKINASKPRLQGGQKTQFANEYHKLQNLIADSMPTRREDRMGYVSPREELNRCKTHHIQMDPGVAKSCGIKLVKGKATGDQAAKAYKMIGKQIGENTNIERIRKEGKSEAQRTIDQLTSYIIDNKISKVG